MEVKLEWFQLRHAWLAPLLWTSTLIGQAQQAAPTAGNSPAEFSEAKKLEQEGKISEAITRLQAVEARDPATPGLALEIGAAYYKKSDFPQAIEYLKKAVAQDPANGESTQLLGLSYYLAGRSAEAIPLLEKV